MMHYNLALPYYMGMGNVNVFSFKTTESRQGTEQMRTFDQANGSADCWSAEHNHNFIDRVK